MLPFTIPFGVRGSLIGLGRMAADGEIIAMRAAGVSARKDRPGTDVRGAAPRSASTLLRLTPFHQALYRAGNELKIAAQRRYPAARLVENFPNTILYWTSAGERAEWKQIFVADVTPPEERTSGMREKATGPRITVADQAIAVPDVKNNRIQLSLRNYATHEMSKDLRSVDSVAPTGDQALEASPPTQTPLRSVGMNTRALAAYPRSKPDWIEIQIELHRRFVPPVAASCRNGRDPARHCCTRGGKSAGYAMPSQSRSSATSCLCFADRHRAAEESAGLA